MVINRKELIMKNYRITVNGNEYDVAVEEVGASTSTSAPKAAPKALGYNNIWLGLAGTTPSSSVSSGTLVWRVE